MRALNLRKSAGAASARGITVAGGTGVLATITRLLGASSTLSLISGTNANLTLVNGNQISAASAISAGSSQTAVVREVLSAEKRAVEYPVVFTRPGAPGALSVLSLSAASLAENSTAGTVVGAILGRSAGSTLTLIDNAGGRFALIGADLVADAVASDFETGTSHAVTLRETLAGSPNSPRDTVLTVTVTNVAEQPALIDLALSASSLAENSTAGTVVGALIGKASGSTLTLTDTAGGRFAISGGDIVAGATPTNFEAATSHSITVRETLADSPNSPRDTVLTIAVANVFEQPSLGALSLSASTATVGTSASISIIGATAGSTIAGAVPDGMVLNSSLRTISGTPTTAGNFNFTLAETLADSANSGRVSAVSMAISEAPAPAPTGTGFIQLEAQSNGGTLGNMVDQLGAGDVGLFPALRIYDNTADEAAPLPTVAFSLVDYVLARAGETFGGKAGPWGERTVIGDGSPVGPTVGLAIDHRAGTVFSGRSLQMFKASSPGKKVSYFQSPGNVAGYDAADADRTAGFKWRAYALRQLRADLAASGAVHRQAFIWWQGEANTNPGRDAANLNHVSITSYASEFAKVYADHVAMTGPQPPWFLVQLLPVWNSTLAARDPYQDAVSAQLKSLCRWTVNMVGGAFSSITDNANGGHANRYFVQHDYTSKLEIQSSDPHVTAVQQKEIGRAISAALRSIHGGDGWTTAYPLATVLPLLSGVTVTASNLTLTVAGSYSDPGTIFVATVPANASAPTKAQIVAGTGGGITGAGSFAATSTTAGTAFSFTANVPAGTQDVYVCLRLATGEISEPVLIEDVVTVTPPLTFDPLFNTTGIAYSNGNRTATRTDTTGNRAVRSTVTTDSDADLYYAEIVVGQAVVWAGLFDSTVTTAGVGATAGVNRVGWNGANATGWNGTTGGTNVAMGSALAAGDVVQIAYRRSTRRAWIRKNGAALWNNTANADPRMNAGGVVDNIGNGGIDAGGMVGEAYLGVTLNTTAASTATVRMAAADWALAPAWASAANEWG
ncbi:MAG: hypothetical protein ACO1OX_07830 [Novosphingobium sp.]